MRTTIALSVLLATASIAGAENPGIFRILKVVDPGTKGALDFSPEAGTNSGSLFVDPLPLISLDDIAESNMVEGDPIKIRLVFTEAGRRKFSEITKQLMGKRIAIIVEGILLSAPRVNEQISGPAIEILWDRGPEEASRFLKRIQKK